MACWDYPLEVLYGYVQCLNHPCHSTFPGDARLLFCCCLGFESRRRKQRLVLWATWAWSLVCSQDCLESCDPSASASSELISQAWIATSSYFFWWLWCILFCFIYMLLQCSPGWLEIHYADEISLEAILLLLPPECENVRMYYHTCLKEQLWRVCCYLFTDRQVSYTQNRLQTSHVAMDDLEFLIFPPLSISQELGCRHAIILRLLLKSSLRSQVYSSLLSIYWHITSG